MTTPICLLILIWLYHSINPDIDCYDLGKEQEEKNPCWTREINRKLLQYAVLCVSTVSVVSQSYLLDLRTTLAFEGPERRRGRHPLTAFGPAVFLSFYVVQILLYTRF